MKSIFLDTSTLGEDIDLSTLIDNGFNWTLFDTSHKDEIPERIKDADIVVSNKAPITAEAIQSAPKLKCILVPATGTNNVDLIAASAAGIPVCNCSGYGTASVSQHVFALILALAVKLPEYSEAAVNGRWAKSPMFCLLDYPVMELAGKNLGIIGFGVLGQSVAKLGEAFGMNILTANRPGSQKIQAGRLPLDELLPQADVISLHCPLTPETENLIGKKEFTAMKNHALLINCARGGIVNESDLLVALKSGLIGGAGIDVLHEEPPVSGNPLLDKSIPNLLVTPHSAWASREARQRIVQMTADNIESFLAGTPQSVVNTI